MGIYRERYSSLKNQNIVKNMKAFATSSPDANAAAVTKQVEVCKSFGIANTPFANAFDAIPTKIPSQKKRC